MSGAIDVRSYRYQDLEISGVINGRSYRSMSGVIDVRSYKCQEF